MALSPQNFTYFPESTSAEGGLINYPPAFDALGFPGESFLKRTKSGGGCPVSRLGGLFLKITLPSAGQRHERAAPVAHVPWPMRTTGNGRSSSHSAS